MTHDGDDQYQLSVCLHASSCQSALYSQVVLQWDAMPQCHIGVLSAVPGFKGLIICDARRVVSMSTAWRNECGRVVGA